MSIYTKSGDKGETSLVGGQRLSKGDKRIDLYGDVDELNSFLGVAISSIEKGLETEIMFKIQSSLFDLGSLLSCEVSERDKFKLPKINESIISELEQNIDIMDNEIPKLKNFILPGGSISAANFHVCRTVCRRVERKIIRYFSNKNDLPDNSVEFLNRLSDYFFTIARFINFKKNISEIDWKPNK